MSPSLCLSPASGHLGEATVEHVAHHLPIIIGDALRKLFDENPSRTVTPTLISNLLSRSIVAFDASIVEDVLDLFPHGLTGLSNEQIRRIINDQHSGGKNYQKVKLCMYGTTALVALVDPEHENLWLANVGDCQAGMCLPSRFLCCSCSFLNCVSSSGFPRRP
jgi:pyruvate dehydrogenase phosphatase